MDEQPRDASPPSISSTPVYHNLCSHSVTHAFSDNVFCSSSPCTLWTEPTHMPALDARLITPVH